MTNQDEKVSIYPQGLPLTFFKSHQPEWPVSVNNDADSDISSQRKATLKERSAIHTRIYEGPPRAHHCICSANREYVGRFQRATKLYSHTVH